MCLGLRISFSRYISPLPKQATDSLRGLLEQGDELVGLKDPAHYRGPPPPAEALISTG